MTPLTTEQQTWVDQTFASLSLRERVGQLLVPMLTPDTARPLSVPDYVAQTGIGGGHVFGGPIARCRSTMTDAQAAAKVPLLLSGDFHVGPGERIPECTRFPGQMAIGATDDDSLAYAYGKAIAVEGRAAGYNWAFGPMVDLAALLNYQRQTDSFGRRPDHVARLATAAIRGLQDHGMAACAKHFPGDGFDDRDQHLMTLVNPLSTDTWWKESAVPFKAAIDAGTWSIMVSCIGLPSLDPDAGDPRNPLPAVVSRHLVTEVLRKQLGFQGVIVTDALNMGGVSYHYRQLDRYRLALLAGNDVLLFVRNVFQTLDYLVQCVEKNDIPETLINDAVHRVLAMKARIGLHRETIVPEDRAAATIANRPAVADVRRLAERSVTLLRDTPNLIPLKEPAGLRVANVLLTNQPKFTLDAFDTVLRDAGLGVTPVKDPATDEIHDRVASGEFDLVITSLYFPNQYGWNTSRIHGPFSRCIMSGYPIAHPDTRALYISFANPYHLYELPFMDPYMVTYSGADSSQQAAARAILGQIPITGRIPVALDNFFNIGDGIQRPAR